MDGKNVSGFKIFAGKERNSKEETLSRIQEKVVLKKLQKKLNRISLKKKNVILNEECLEIGNIQNLSAEEIKSGLLDQSTMDLLIDRGKFTRHDVIRRYNKNLQKTNGFDKYKFAWVQELEKRTKRDVLDYDLRLVDYFGDSKNLNKFLQGKYANLDEHMHIVGDLSLKDHKKFIKDASKEKDNQKATLQDSSESKLDKTQKKIERGRGVNDKIVVGLQLNDIGLENIEIDSKNDKDTIYPICTINEHKEENNKNLEEKMKFGLKTKHRDISQATISEEITILGDDNSSSEDHNENSETI